VHTLFTIIFLFLISSSTFSFTTTNFQYLKNTEKQKDSETLTFEYFGTWAYGDNFFMAEHREWNDFFLMLYSPRLSLNKILKIPMPKYLIKDVFATGELHKSNVYEQTNYGFALAFKVPGVDVLDFKLLFKEDTSTPAKVWNWWHGGLVDRYGLLLEGVAVWGDGFFLTQPQLLFDIGLPIKGVKRWRYFVGIEIFHEHFDRPITFTQVMMKCVI